MKNYKTIVFHSTKDSTNVLRAISWLFHLKRFNLGTQDGLEVKGSCCQAWKPESNAQTQHMVERESRLLQVVL